jgi:hypothetical protein
VIFVIILYQSGIRVKFSQSRETCHGEEKEEKEEKKEMSKKKYGES